MSAYVYNPACHCDWCANQGTNPEPDSPAALGYDEPHIPTISAGFLNQDIADPRAPRPR